MKLKSIVVYVLLAITLTLCSYQLVFANEAKTHQEQVQEFCGNESKIAGSIMRYRQLGASAAKLIELAEGNSLWISYVQYAYSQPQYSTEEYRSKAEQEFSNTVFMQCYKAGSKMKNSKPNPKSI